MSFVVLSMRFVFIKTKFGIWCFNDNEKEFFLRTTEQLGVIVRSVVRAREITWKLSRTNDGRFDDDVEKTPTTRDDDDLITGR